MITIKVECGNGVQDSIKECITLVEKLGVGTMMDVNGTTIIVMPWNTFDEVYNRYLEDLRDDYVTHIEDKIKK